MPFEQKYSPETREAALARVLARREAEAGNRAIIRETAEQFDVGEQSLRGWIRSHEKSQTPAGPEQEQPSEETDSALVEPAAETPARRPRSATAAPSDARVAELEAEVAKLRRDRETLKNALAVLLSD